VDQRTVKELFDNQERVRRLRWFIRVIRDGYCLDAILRGRGDLKCHSPFQAPTCPFWRSKTWYLMWRLQGNRRKE